METIPRHQCLIYEASPAPHLSSLAALIRQKLSETTRCLYLNSPPMVAGVRSYLSAVGVDVEQESTTGRLVMSSDQGNLVNGRFDVDRMLAMLDTALNQALSDGYESLWATGDMSWEFGPEKDFSKLLDYEWRLEEYMTTHSALSGICQYHMDMLPRQVVRHGIVSHRSIFVSDTLSRLNPEYLPARSFFA